jgi:acetyl esterase/lipase
MKKLLLIVSLFLLALTNLVHAQYCTQDNRFTEIEYFSLQDLDSVSNIVYGSAIDYQGTTTALKLDIYFPDQHVDLFNLRPLVLMIHGGGFIAGNKEDRKTECIALAQ